MKETNVTPNTYPEQHEAYFRILVELASRMSPYYIERMRRQLNYVVDRGGSDEPFIDPFSLLNPDLSVDQIKKVTTGVLVNLVNIMSTKDKRVKPDVIKLSPPLGSPIQNLTLTQGDIDDLEDLYDEETPEEVVNAVSDLSASRQQTAASLSQDPSVMKNVAIMTNAVVDGLTNTESESEDVMQAVSDNIAAKTKRRKIKIRPKAGLRKGMFAKGKAKRQAKRAAKRANVGEGAIPLAVISNIIKVGGIVADYAPYLVSLYRSATGNVPADKLPEYAYSATSDDSFLGSLHSKLTKSRCFAAAGRAKTLRDQIAQIILQGTDPVYKTPAAVMWKDLFAKKYSSYLMDKTTRGLMQGLYRTYRKINPEQASVQAMLQPIPQVPALMLMHSVWDPELITKEDVVWADIESYFKAASAADPAWGKKFVLPFNGYYSAFSSGKSVGAPVDTNSKDGWDDVSKAYLTGEYQSIMKVFFDSWLAYLREAMAFARKMATVYPNASIANVFPSSDVSTFAPWDAAYMKNFFQTVDAINAKLNTSTNNTYIPSNSNVGNNNNQPVVDPVINPSVDPNVPPVIIPNTGSSTSNSGTVLITPHETIIGLGNYVDPATNQVSDINDLYQLGLSVENMRKQASLMLNLPGRPFSGDIGEGSPVIAIAGLLGKKLLSSPGVKRLFAKIGAKKRKAVLENILRKNPASIKAVALASKNREQQAAATLSNPDSLPLTPGAIKEYMAALRIAAPHLKTDDQRLSMLLDLMGQIKIGTLSNDAILNHGSNLSDIPNELPEVASYGEAAAAALDPTAVALYSDSDEDGEGDIDLWHIL